MGKIIELYYPESFEKYNIYQHSKFTKEFKEILEESGYKDDFIRSFRLRIKFLNERMETCTLKRDWFERLKGTEELYSMKIKGKLNIRIIFIFTQHKRANIALLLNPFQEKDKKNNSKTSYNKAIEVAYNWLREIEQ